MSDEHKADRWAEISEANQRQVGGDHYKKAGATGEEHWDRVVRLDMDYLRACATKYIERCWDKNGIQDLEKAGHYIQKAIEVARAQGRKGKAEFRKLVDSMPTGPAMPQWEPHSTNQFTYEGGHGTGDLPDHYTCNHCHTHFDVPINAHPAMHHTCGVVRRAVEAAEAQGRGYVNQDEPRAAAAYAKGYEDGWDSMPPDPAYREQNPYDGPCVGPIVREQLCAACGSPPGQPCRRVIAPR